MQKYFHNLGAGPSEIYDTVKTQLAEALISWDGTGISLLSFPHRHEKFYQVISEAKNLLYEFMEISENEYDIVFMQGGARQQFTQIPMNFLPENGEASYIVAGHWAELSFQEAKKYGKSTCLASSKESNYNFIPQIPEISESNSYLHITTNNTIFGTQYATDPLVKVPLIADMSSDFLGKKRDFSKYDFIYAGAQKNLGPAGVVVVIIKKSLTRVKRDIPDIFNYDTIIKENSLYNTPNTFGIYSILLTLREIKNRGGLDAIHHYNEQKQKIVYHALDSNEHFKGHSKIEDRSWMNVTFTIPNEEIATKFREICEKEGIFGVVGHRSVGGFRASLYNAVSLESAKLLAEIIQSLD